MRLRAKLLQLIGDIDSYESDDDDGAGLRISHALNVGEILPSRNRYGHTYIMIAAKHPNIGAVYVTKKTFRVNTRMYNIGTFCLDQ